MLYIRSDMCYAKPGPRCSAHARKALVEARRKHARAKTDDERLTTMALVTKAEQDYDTTPDGQKELAKRIADGDDKDGVCALRLERGISARNVAKAAVEKQGLLEDLHEQPSTKKTSNVSNFETAFVDAVADPSKTSELNQFPDNQRPKAFRGKTIDASLIRNFRHAVMAATGSRELSLTSERNNRIGADFYEENSRTHIEVKLGAATDVNFGTNRLTEIFGETFSSRLPSSEDRERWREQFLAGHKEEQLADYRKRLADSAEAMEQDAKAGRVTLNQDTLNRMALGKMNIGADERVRRVILSEDGDWSVADDRSVAGDWKIHAVECTPRARINIYLTNEKYQMRLTYNQKNTYRAGDFKENPAPPTHGLGTPSFNGWVTPLNQGD